MHSELLARLEAATAIDQRDALISAYIAIYDGDHPEFCSSTRALRFMRMLNAEAYESGALTLVEDKDETLREALRWLNKRFHLHINPWPEGENYAQWLALATVIAALRAKGDA